MIYRPQSSLDPFFIVQIFNNAEKKVGKLKVTRVGVSREFFSRFYHIEQKHLSSYLKRFPSELNFESFQSIAADSVDQREWGIALLEPQSNNWGVVCIRQIELADKLTNITINGDYITLTNGEK